METSLDRTMVGVLDVLLTNPHFRAPFGHIIRDMATLVYGYPVLTGEQAYHTTASAIVRLEREGFITVDRYYERRSSKANVLTAIHLCD